MSPWVANHATERKKGPGLAAQPSQDDGLLLAELATLTRNRVVPAGPGDEPAFSLLSEPTPLQARALALVGVSPGSM